MPFTNCVLPAPSSPASATISPAFKSSAQRAPVASVSAALFEMNIAGRQFGSGDCGTRKEFADAREPQLGKLFSPARDEAFTVARRNGKEQFVVFSIGNCLF